MRVKKCHTQAALNNKSFKYGNGSVVEHFVTAFILSISNARGRRMADLVKCMQKRQERVLTTAMHACACAQIIA